MKTEPVSITIVTSTLNCAKGLAATAASLRSQNWHATQWIVADGGSTDDTISVIHRNADVIGDWYSEPDRGIYDAWNKACRLIRGEWVMFLGAGDLFSQATTLTSAAGYLTNIDPEIDFLYGNVVQTRGRQVLYRYGEVDLLGWQLCRPAVPAHQGVFHRARLFRSEAPFDDTYRIAGDTKLMLQHMHVANTRYVDLDVATMEAGGVSSHPASALKVMREVLRLEAELGYRIPPVQRALYVARSYSKALLSRLIGSAAVDSLIRTKQRLIGPNT